MSSTFNLNGSVDGTPIMVPMTLEGAGATINGVAAQIMQELEVLRNQLMATESFWQGQAKEDYDILQHEWDTAARGLFGGGGAPGVLGEIAHMMDVNWANYTDAEFSNTKVWRGV
jgi:hypothetical protein